MVDVAEVKIWGHTVGAVRWDNERSLAFFQYDKKFLQLGWDLAPIKMPISNGDRIYSFPELRKSKNEHFPTFKGLPGLLADALPDKYGNQLINIWLAQNGRPPNSMNPVEQLSFIGSRGMGALEFDPAHQKIAKRTFHVELSSLVDLAQKMLHNRKGFETNLKKDEHKAMQEILKIGTSAGGARPKAVIAFNKKSGQIRSGQTRAPQGYEHWLLKLDGVSDAQFGASHGYGRVEFAYYLMALACKINMMESQLIEENGRAHFMTKRFDRGTNNERHHIQSFCGIQHFDYNHLESYSYEQLFQTMRMLKLPYPAAEEMFRRMVFNVMATNYDDHTKNFSFRLKRDSEWELSPAYDMCYSYDPGNSWVSRHTLSINGKHAEINFNDLMQIASENNIKKPKQIIEHIKDVVCQWDDFANESSVSTSLRESISKTLIAPTFEI